jgi:hypothetical protein
MPSIDYVIEGLMSESGGQCPECGEQVIVDRPPPRPAPSNLLTLAVTLDEVRAVPVVDLPLSIRCRLAICQMGFSTVGELLDLGRQNVHERLREHPDLMEEVVELFGRLNLEW